MGLPARKKRGGRPPTRKVKPGDRVQLGLRVTPEIKKMIDDASAYSGRSQSQEVEFRLERSFHDEGILEEALTLKYGARLADVVMTLADAMRLTIYPAVVLGYQVGQDFDEKNWLQDRQSYDLASKAATMVLEARHPDSTITLDAMMEDAPNKRRADDAPYWGVTSALLEAKWRQDKRKRK